MMDFLNNDGTAAGTSLICNLKFQSHTPKLRPRLNCRPSMAKQLRYTGIYGAFLSQHANPVYCFRRGGKICTSIHFKPLWSKNVPRFGLAHCTRIPHRTRYTRLPRDTNSAHVVCNPHTCHMPRSWSRPLARNRSARACCHRHHRRICSGRVWRLRCCQTIKHNACKPRTTLLQTRHTRILLYTPVFNCSSRPSKSKAWRG